LAACMTTRSSQDWLSTCDRLDIPAAPLRRLADLESDPHLVATGFFQQMHDPLIGTLIMPRAPLKFNGVFVPAGRLPPRLGEHTREILAEAGLPLDRIEALIRSGAATQSEFSLSDQKETP
jgi:crotonobetainyl-CoA:carnitine CoA-transferase CaiB-like acyl-CoA transferase